MRGRLGRVKHGSTQGGLARGSHRPYQGRDDSFCVVAGFHLRRITPSVETGDRSGGGAARRLEQHSHPPVATTRAAQSAFESRQRQVTAARRDLGRYIERIAEDAFTARSRCRTVLAAVGATRQPSESARPIVSTPKEQIMYKGQPASQGWSP
jgi:hypothetical protein